MGKIPESKGTDRVWIQDGKIFKSVSAEEAKGMDNVIAGKPLPPRGGHAARCYAIYDVGTQHVNYNFGGKTIDKWQRKVYLFWEMPSFRCHMTTKEDELLNRPLSINKEYTFSNSEKGNLMKDLKSWLGAAEVEGDDFEINELISKVCFLNVDRKLSQAGRERADIMSIMELPDEMTEPKAENDPVTFLFEEDFEASEIRPPDYVPEWIAKKIMESREVQERQEAGASVAAALKHSEQVESTGYGEDDNLPF